MMLHPGPRANVMKAHETKGIRIGFHSFLLQKLPCEYPLPARVQAQILFFSVYNDQRRKKKSGVKRLQHCRNQLTPLGSSLTPLRKWLEYSVLSAQYNRIRFFDCLNFELSFDAFHFHVTALRRDGIYQFIQPHRLIDTILFFVFFWDFARNYSFVHVDLLLKIKIAGRILVLYRILSRLNSLGSARIELYSFLIKCGSLPRGSYTLSFIIMSAVNILTSYSVEYFIYEAKKLIQRDRLIDVCLTFLEL